jgi:ubiquitin-conjugating enzyme E2 variant
LWVRRARVVFFGGFCADECVRATGPPGTNFENRIYELNFICGEKYPTEPPIVSFRSRVNLPCVNQRGEVPRASLPVLKGWQYGNRMEEVLMAIKAQMAANKKLPQPQDGAMYA